MSTNQKFLSEMRALHDSFKTFSTNQPRLSQKLNLNEFDDKDPSVERLLEGVAYIGSEIQNHLDQDIPEISEILLDQVSPELLKPIVSTCIIQFYPKENGLQKTEMIKRGSYVKKRIIENDFNGDIKFRTTENAYIQPLQIDRVYKQTNSSNKDCLYIKFACEVGVDLNKLRLSDFPLFVHADHDKSCKVYALLLNVVDRITVCVAQKPLSQALSLAGMGHYLNGGIENIYHHIKNFFISAENYALLRVKGLDGVVWPVGCQQFELCFQLNDTGAKSVELLKENFRINCVVAENIFEKSAEPLTLNHFDYEYPLMIDANFDQHYALHNVQAVQGFDQEQGRNIQYNKLQSFDYSESDQSVYQLKIRNLMDGDKRYFLKFNEVSELSNKVISTDLLVSNAHHARKYIQQREVSEMDSASKNMTLCNLNRPSRYVDSPKTSMLRWQLLSYMTLQLNTLLDVENLKLILNLLNWAQSIKIQRKISALLQIKSQTENTFYKGSVYPLVKIQMDVDDKLFTSEAEVYVFFEVIYSLFVESVQLNHLIDLSINCIASGKQFNFANRGGRKLAL